MSGGTRSEPLLVVGSGRCGSTLISTLLNDAPEFLSLSEFFFNLSPNGFPGHPIDGAEFWRWLSEPHRDVIAGARVNLLPPELIYPFDGGFRFDRSNGAPPILLTPLPAVTDDFDAVYDELAKWVPDLGMAEPREHYLRLFDWLAQRLGRTRWSERSGGSSAYVPELLETFPDARFVHVYRDGVPAALSMKKHFGFRIEQVKGAFKRTTGFDPWDEGEPPAGWEQPAELAGLGPTDFDPATFLALEFEARRLGGYWSRMIRIAVRGLRGVDPARVMHLRYESLVEDPGPQLQRFADFVGVEDAEAWVQRSIPQVRRPTPLPELDPEMLAELVRACRPGRLELVKAGLDTVPPE
jgi:putative sulfotransferase